MYPAVGTSTSFKTEISKVKHRDTSSPLIYCSSKVGKLWAAGYLCAELEAWNQKSRGSGILEEHERNIRKNPSLVFCIDAPVPRCVSLTLTYARVGAHFLDSFGSRGFVCRETSGRGCRDQFTAEQHRRRGVRHTQVVQAYLVVPLSGSSSTIIDTIYIEYSNVFVLRCVLCLASNSQSICFFSFYLYPLRIFNF